MGRKVKINFTLVGKSFDIKRSEVFDSISILNTIKKNVLLHFGNRPLLISEEDFILSKSSYPQYFSAGWFISDQSIENNESGSELVVVGHGENMILAQADMMRGIGSADWNTLAKNI